MNLMLHAHWENAGSEKSVPVKVADALAADPGERFDLVLANPPFEPPRDSQRLRWLTQAAIA